MVCMNRILFLVKCMAFHAEMNEREWGLGGTCVEEQKRALLLNPSLPTAADVCVKKSIL